MSYRENQLKNMAKVTTSECTLINPDSLSLSLGHYSQNRSEAKCRTHLLLGAKWPLPFCPFLRAWASAAGNCGKVMDKIGDWTESGHTQICP